MERTPLLVAAAKNLRRKRLPRGQTLLYQNDLMSNIFILTKGVIKIYDIDDDGNEKILHLLSAYGVLPFAFFSGKQQRIRWFYATLTDCEVCVVSQASLLELIQVNPALNIELMNWFSLEVHELLVRLSSLSKTNAQDKVMAALRYLAVCHVNPVRGDWLRVNFPVNHQLLADMTGLTRESTALIMSKLQKQGKVRSPRQLTLELSPRILPV